MGLAAEAGVAAVRLDGSHGAWGTGHGARGSGLGTGAHTLTAANPMFVPAAAQERESATEGAAPAALLFPLATKPQERTAVHLGPIASPPGERYAHFGLRTDLGSWIDPAPGSRERLAVALGNCPSPLPWATAPRRHPGPATNSTEAPPPCPPPCAPPCRSRLAALQPGCSLWTPVA
jgi:hypothetical protein